MYTGEFIYDFYPETSEVANVLKTLKGDHQLLFAMRDYEREDTEYLLRYTIDDGIVASSGPEITKKYFGFSNSFKWFEPRNDKEIAACIEAQRHTYFGCVLERGKPLDQAKFAFNYIENLRVMDDSDAALYICAEEASYVNDFLMGLEGYTCIEFRKDDRIWLSEESEYMDIWDLQ
jgi:hypothetical protein